jgi:hypothetical protein
VLLPNGADHHARQPGRARAVTALGAVARPARVLLSSLRAFAEAIVAAAATRPLPEVAGELRDSYGYAWTLQGTFGSRSALKRRARLAERTLLRDAEPWVALAAWQRGGGQAPSLRAAWRALLRCHPHDTLCGCSVDEVARAMAVRLEDVAAQTRGLRDDALASLIGHDAAAARDRPPEWRPSLVVRNAAARARGGVAIVNVQVAVEHQQVGPGSAPRLAPAPEMSAPAWSVARGALLLQPLSAGRHHHRIESPLHYPWDDIVETTRAIAWVPEVPGYGTRSFPVRLGAVSHPQAIPEVVHAGDTWMENGVLRVDVDERGAVRLTTRDDARVIHSLFGFESMADAGDLYTPSLRGIPRMAELSGTQLRHRGPLRAALELRMHIGSPAAIALTATVTLDAGAPFLRIAVDGENAAADHRLRIRIATDVDAPAVFADAAFGTVLREPIVAPPGSAEAAPPTAPLARYVTLAGSDRGATLYADGLAEYEVMTDGAVAVTLLRAVGELSRNDLPERPGHAGWPASTPEAQEPGAFRAGFALLLHGARDDATIAEIERISDDVLHPLVGDTVRATVALPPDTAGASLLGDGLAFSAIKPSADGNWLVLRCVNLLGAPVQGAWELGAPVREAWLSRLDETRGEPLAVDERRVAFVAPPYGIVTILLR